MNTDNMNIFDEKRKEFTPYGLTCELWQPNEMSKCDRHNEVELNYLPKGEITYIFNESEITIPSRTLSLFWGAIPHQIINYNNTLPYYVCTIPTSIFLSWRLPSTFVNEVFAGKVFIETLETFSDYDEFILKNWFNDIPQNTELIISEMNSRILRLANTALYKNSTLNQNDDFQILEKIIIYVAQNYMNPINIQDIGNLINLNPDYANKIFKKAFNQTLYDYIIQERISHSKRMLLSSNNSITEIAFECGFNSISRFNFMFKKYTGYSARDFRKYNNK